MPMKRRYILKEGIFMSKKSLFSTQTLVTISLLTALSIVFTRVVGIQVTETLRISIGNLPIVLAGVLFGPIAGGLTGLVSDFIGTVFLSPFVWFPPLAITPVLVGVLPALIRIIFFKNRQISGKILMAMLIPTYLVGPLFWSTMSLHWLYGVPVESMLYTRVPFSFLVAVVEIIMTYILIKAGAFRPLGFGFGGKKNELRGNTGVHS